MTPTLASTSNTTQQLPPEPTEKRYCQDCGRRMAWVVDRPYNRWVTICYTCLERTSHGQNQGGDNSRQLAYSPDFWSEDWLQMKDRFFKNLESRSAGTAKTYASLLGQFFSMSANGRPKRPEDYRYADVEAYLNRPNEKGKRNGGLPPRSGTKGLVSQADRRADQLANLVK